MSISMQRPIKRWRLILFAVFAILIALLFAALFGGAPSLLSPWILMAPNTPTYHAEIHRWHDSAWGVLTVILLAGSMLTLLSR